MKNKKYKTMKVFDCWDMPENISKLFFDVMEGTGNDCYVNWCVNSSTEESKDEA